MSKEIKKETTWLGETKWVTYEDGEKTGESKRERGGFLGLGEEREVTYDTHGQKLSETKQERDWRGRPKDVIYEHGRRVGELRREDGVTDIVFDTKRKVLHEAPGRDIDLTKRATRKTPAGTEASFSGSDYSYEAPTPSPRRESGKRNSDEIARRDTRNRLYVYSYTSPQAIKRALESGFYSGVTFVPDKYLVRYRCDRCGHEWEGILPETHIGSNETVDCRMGCSRGANDGSSLGMYKIIKNLFSGKKPFGYGRLIKSEKIG